LRTDPIDIQSGSGFEDVYNQLSNRENEMVALAHEQKAHVLSIGANPFIPVCNIARSNKLKYRMVPNFHNTNRKTPFTFLGDEKIDIGDASVVGLLNSVQANIEAKSFEDSIDKLNRSFAISPLMVALTANARFLDLKDTSYEDVRMVAWEVSHDTRTQEERDNGILTRVGLPENYYTDISDYLQRIMAYPFILNVPDHALEVGIGLNWRDARIKFIGNSAVVEFRPVSTQITPEENISAMAFFVGRLLWSQRNNEQLLPMHLVHINKREAMAHGNNATLWVHEGNNGFIKVSAQEVLPIETERAIKGLEEHDIPNMEYNRELITKLGKNIIDGTPSSQLTKHVKATHAIRKEAIISGLSRINAIS
jgi:hypothetical protein